MQTYRGKKKLLLHKWIIRQGCFFLSTSVLFHPSVIKRCACSYAQHGFHHVSTKGNTITSPNSSLAFFRFHTRRKSEATTRDITYRESNFHISHYRSRERRISQLYCTTELIIPPAPVCFCCRSLACAFVFGQVLEMWSCSTVLKWQNKRRCGSIGILDIYRGILRYIRYVQYNSLLTKIRRSN